MNPIKKIRVIYALLIVGALIAMPSVKGKKFPYTVAGKKAAAAAALKPKKKKKMMRPVMKSKY